MILDSTVFRIQREVIKSYHGVCVWAMSNPPNTLPMQISRNVQKSWEDWGHSQVSNDMEKKS